MSPTDRFKVLFVCMGNICRSPTAEGYFRHHLQQAGLAAAFEVDSAGTHGYHVGHPPDERARQTAAKRGIDLSALRARQLTAEDFDHFDLVLGMDDANMAAIASLGQGRAARVARMLDWGGGALEEVPDPYYGGQSGFEQMCDLLDTATAALLESLRREI